MKSAFHVKPGPLLPFIVVSRANVEMSHHADIVAALRSVKAEPAGTKIMRADGKLMAVRVPMRPTDRKLAEMLRNG